MPMLDVSMVILDPYFNDNTFVCERIVQTVGTDGRAVNTPSTFPFNGCMTNNYAAQLKRIADGERTTMTIRIHTKSVLIVSDQNNTADIIQWQGQRFTVVHVNPWSRYGAGFHDVLAEIISINQSNV